MFRVFNPNPKASRVGDCTVRAISRLLNQTWEQTYCDLCIYGLLSCDMPSANSVWGKYLKNKGYSRHMIEDYECTVSDFCHDHTKGKYLLALNGHVVTVEDGDYFDTWDSGKEVVVYYWSKEE